MPRAPTIPVQYRDHIEMDNKPDYLTGLDLFLHRLFQNHSPEEIYQMKIDVTSFGEVVGRYIRYHRKCRNCGQLSEVKLKL